MKYDNQLRYAIQIVNAYTADIPLHNWLKNFFRQHKQMGSRDRKQVSELVYCFYRLGHAAKKFSIEERILTGLFFCNHISNEILQYFKPSWNENISLPVEKKIALHNSEQKNSSSHFHLHEIFPWKDRLSNNIDHLAFCASFLQQPSLFIRIRPGYENTVKKKLQSAKIPFSSISPSCISFTNSTRLEDIVLLNKEAVIQDLNSQRLADYYEITQHISSGKPHAWDCCAASGGKSIMLYDKYPGIDLTVSDIRESILINLKKRFKEAGIKNYHAFVSDLAKGSRIASRDTSYDLIIADVPCSGSGTWARTPEALYFFDIRETDRYSTLQQKITAGIIPHLKKTGTLTYSTCSVFKKENEEIVDFIQQKSQLSLEKMETLTGYDQKADSMFAARFIA